jgi:hypothetical protein
VIWDPFRFRVELLFSLASSNLALQPPEFILGTKDIQDAIAARMVGVYSQYGKGTLLVCSDR